MPKYKQNILFSIIFLASYSLFAHKFWHYYTPDATLYISIAEHLVNGEFHNAVNGYWSPLTSWILAPLLFILKDGILSFKILNLFLSIFIVFRIYTILDFYKIKDPIKLFITSCCCLFIPIYGVLYLTADVLLTALLLHYYYLLLTDKLYSKPLLYSITGACIYFCKAYGLYFFTAHSVFYFIAHKDSWKYLSSFLKGLAFFILFCGVWIAILSNKYSQFTISTASGYNQSLITEDNIILHPCDSMKLMPPFPSERYSAWEEMSLHVKKPEQKNKNIYTYRHIRFNVVQLAHLIYSTPRYSILLLVPLLLLVFFKKQLSRNLLLPSSLICIYTAGYLFFFIEERYLLFVVITLLILQTMLIDKAVSLFSKLQFFLFPFLLFGTAKYLTNTYTSFPTRDEDICYNIHTQTKEYSGNRNYVTYRPFEFYILSYMNQWKNFSGIKNYKEDSLSLQKDLNNNKIDFIIIPNSVKLPQNIQSLYFDLRLTNIDGYQVWKKH